MQKNMVKTESVSEFLARGGKIEKVAPKGPKKTYKKAMKEAINAEDINLAALPIALRIKFGLR